MRVLTRSSILDAAARHWWAFVLRGVLAVLFGLAALFWPVLTFTVLLALFGVYAIADGVLSLVAAFRDADRLRWVRVVAGVASIAIGVAVFLWPGVTAVALVYFIAVWAIVTGIIEVVAAIALRREIEAEWLLALAGILSILVGGWLVASPGAGALALTWLIGAYAIGFGVILVIVGVRLRGWNRQAVDRSARTPA